MRPFGRRYAALLGLVGAAGLLFFTPAQGRADTLRTDIELSTRDCGTREQPLGDLLADAVRAADKADVAFLPASAFAEVTMPKGAFTAADVVRALEDKSDTISLVKLSGDQIVRAVEHGLYLYPRFNSGFLHVSGITLTINPDAEKGKRTGSVKVGGAAVDTGRKYTVAMPTPLANGALAYFKIWKKTDIDRESDSTLESAVNAYLKTHKTITKMDERLIVKK